LTGNIVITQKFEAFAKCAAMFLDLLPELRVGRVVDDDDTFEIRVFKPCDRIERPLSISAGSQYAGIG
jgi:hypothetical protein